MKLNLGGSTKSITLKMATNQYNQTNKVTTECLKLVLKPYEESVNDYILETKN